MTTKLDYGYALRSLYDDQQWILKGTDSLSGLEWTGPKPRPSKQELDIELARLQAEYDALEYQRLREPEYPPIKDQLDELNKSLKSNVEILRFVRFELGENQEKKSENLADEVAKMMTPNIPVILPKKLI